MKQTLDTVWRRRGIGWIWDAEVWSLRQFLGSVCKWSEDLPSNSGKTLVVAGLEGGLDLLSPAEAEKWLENDIKPALLSFQDFWASDAALIFWLPGAAERIRINSANDAVAWRCAAPHSGEVVDFGRILWGEAHEYPQEIILRSGAKSAGLFHLRIT